MKRKCNGCQKIFRARTTNSGFQKFCSLECKMEWKYNLSNPTIPIQLEAFSLLFWSFVDKKKKNECWLWKGYKDNNGYGKIVVPFFIFHPHKGPQLAHRVAMFLHHRAFDRNSCVLHNCPNGDNPSCVNPRHLWFGTIKDNNRDMIKKGRFKHHGGLLGEANPFSKLKEDDVKKIRVLADKGWNNSKIGRKFKLHPSTVRDIVLRKRWKHV